MAHTEEELKAWSEAVMASSPPGCSNCGGTDHLAALPVVPFDLGGSLMLENGRVLCRTCRFVALGVGQGRDETQRPINVLMSRELYDLLGTLAQGASMGAVVRKLMGLYLETPDAFEDLGFYQDSEAKVKLNVWAPRALYEAFQTAVTARGLTVSDALRGLVMLYHERTKG